jgi:hypothetical protein
MTHLFLKEKQALGYAQVSPVIIVLTHESSARNLTDNRMHIEITRGTAG